MHQVLTVFLSTMVNALLLDSANSLYIAIGEGNISWDEGLPDITPVVYNLYREVAKKKIKSINYFNTLTNEISATPTDTLLVTSEMFNGEDYIGPVRECGLFMKKEGIFYLIAYSVFNKIELTEQVTITKNLLIKLI